MRTFGFSKAAFTPILLAGCAGLYCAGPGADTLLFPVIATNTPNVTTVVSVSNRPAGISSHLHYLYRYKSSLAGDGSPNHSGSCSTVEFTRQTFDGDLVSFDASGSLNSGGPLFGDTNSYGGTFDHGIPGAARSFLLVTNSDAAGNRIDVGQVRDLSGEAVIMDIAFGAAWGMKGINDRTREDFSMINASDSGGVYSALPSQGFDNRRFSFFPTSQWATRFFVTPIGVSMDIADLSATINLVSSGGSIEGVYDRQGTRHSFTPIDLSITCTGAVDLNELMDSTTRAAVEQVGGWTWLRVVSGDAAVYKLEFVVENPVYGGTINNGFLLSGYEL